MSRMLDSVFRSGPSFFPVPRRRNGRAVHLTLMVSDGPGAEPLIHAALTRVSLTDSVLSCLSRSAASWHWIQRDAHGTAARLFGRIANSHSIQTPKLPS